MKNLIFVFCLLLLSVQVIVAQQNIYVRSGAMPTGNGQSWATAYPRLQDALNTAQAGDEIRVAAGIYKPTDDTDRERSFFLKSQVRLRGGFAGAGPNPDEHAPAQHLTILSGDIGIPDDHSDNTYNILSSSGSLEEGTLLEGFIIEHGSANSTDPAHLALHPQRAGAGIYFDKGTICDLTIRYCVFRSNEATGHGGHACFYLLSALSNLSVEHCTFEDGSGASAFYFRGSATDPIRLNKCVFRGNSIANRIMYILNFNSIRKIEMSECRFEGNEIGGQIIGVHRADSIFINDCIFDGNSNFSSIIDVYYNSYASLLRDTFINNLKATNSSINNAINLTGVSNWPLSDFTKSSFALKKCVFEGNELGSLLRGFESGMVEACSFRNNKIKTLLDDYNTTEKGKEVSVNNCLFERNNTHLLLSLESHDNGSGAKGKSTWNFNQSLFSDNKGLLFDSRYHNVLNDTTKLRWNFCTFTENQRWVDTTDSSLRCLFYLKGVDSVEFNSCVIDQQLEADETLFFDSLSHIRLDNCLLRADSCGQIYTYGGNNVVCGSENHWGIESFFENSQTGDFRLEVCAPGINRGDTTRCTQLGLESDFGGNPRRANLLPDVGAFERKLSVVPYIEDYSCSNPVEASIVFQSESCGPYTITWSNGQQQGANTTNLASGQYSITATDAHGIQHHTTLGIPEYAAITIDTLLIHPTTMSASDAAIAVLVMQGNAPPYQYQWNTGAVGPNLVGVAAGQYKLTVTDRFGCVFVFQFDLKVASSSLEADVHTNQLIAWPNPTSNQIYLTIPSVRLENVSRFIEISDATGRLVLTQSVPVHSEKLALSLQAFSSGLYFLVLKEDGLPTHVGKVIKY